MTGPMIPHKEMRAELFLTDRWVDITDDIRQTSGQTSTQGAASQDRVVPPLSCTAVLENASGRYTRRDPLSPNYGKLGTNTPFRTTNGLTSDHFARTSVNSWGLSEHGDLWSAFLFGGGTSADFQVAGGIATHTVGATVSFRGSYLPEQTHRNVSVSVEFSLSFTNVTGGNLEPANLLIRGVNTGDYLMARVVLTTSETFTVQIMTASGTVFAGPVAVPGLTHVADRWFKVLFQAESGTARVKLWQVDTTVADSDGEPQAWSIEAEVPAPARGWVGVRSGVGSGNTNIPVTFKYRNFEVRSPRLIGESSVVAPKWDVVEKNRTASLTASGITRRLGQGSPVLKSTLRRSIPSLPGLVAYWPAEDGSEATSLTSGIIGAPEMTMDGDQQPAAYGEIASSEPIPTLGVTHWRGNVTPYASTGAFQVRWLMHQPPDDLPDNTHLMRVWCTGGTIASWTVYSSPTGDLRVIARTATAEVVNLVIGFDMRGINARVSLELSQDGSDVDWGLWVYEVGAPSAGGFAATVTGQTLGIASQVAFGLGTDMQGTAVGQVTVQSTVTSIFDLITQINAYNGETATARLGRLCVEESVPLSISGEHDPDAKMGPQRPDTLLNLLAQCAEVDQGILGESRAVLGLKYRTRFGLLNQPVAVTLDRSKFEIAPPFDPVDDDRLTINDVTAERINGSKFRAEQTAGPMSTQPPPSGAGRYDTNPKFAAFSDGQLPDLAGWLLSLGTVDEYRIPAVTADFTADAVVLNRPLTYDLWSLDVGDRMVITGLDARGIYDDMHQLVRGFTETQVFLGENKIESNTFPYSPYIILVLDDSELGRADSDSSTVRSAFSATALSFQVDTTDRLDLWTTDGAEFPQDVIVAGERMTLSGISGASSPQTFTVSARSVNGVVKAHVAGSQVHVFSPVHLA